MEKRKDKQYNDRPKSKHADNYVINVPITAIETRKYSGCI